MDSVPTETTAAPALGEREAIDDRFKWKLTHIFSDWDAWKAGYDELETRIAAYAALQGTLTVNTANGVASFSSLRIDQAGAG